MAACCLRHMCFGVQECHMKQRTTALKDITHTTENLDKVRATLQKFIEFSLHGDVGSWDAWLSATVPPLNNECWEIKQCKEKTECPAYQSDSGRCWLIAGTMCGGMIQGEFARKYSTCVQCDVFQRMVFNDPATELQEHILILIHSLKTKQQELQEAKDRYKMLFDDAPVMYVITFLDEQEPIIEDCNDEFLRTLGYTRDEVIGESLSRYYSEESLAELKAGGYRQAQKAGMGEIERVLVKSDGSLLHALLIATPRGDHNPAGSLVMFVDLTDRKRIEREKAKLEAQIRQIYKMEALGTMAGGVAHDFNNILAIILGNADLAKNEFPESSLGAEYLETIITASKRAKSLVRQILAFSRQTDQEAIPIQLGPVIDDFLKLLRATTPPSVRFKLNICEDCGVIMADPTQIEQVFMNLFSNAVQAMRGKGIIEVTLAPVEFSREDLRHNPDMKPGQYLRLSVSDTGAGIAKYNLAQIFDPFFTTGKIGQGTGMGLSVVHGIVHNHDGMITVESELGTGTTFHVSFPVIKREVGTAG